MISDKMSKEEFLEFLEEIRYADKIVDDVYNATGGSLDLLNLTDDLIKPYRKCFSKLFGENDSDMITWYLYEDVEKNIYEAGTHKIIDVLDTDEKLWDYLNRE
jgi:hypothetical protein